MASRSAPWRSRTLGEQYFSEGDHVGATITVTVEVEEVVGLRLFELSAGNFGDAPLQVVTAPTL